MLPLTVNWDIWSWILGGALGVIMFTAIIIHCVRTGALCSPKKDPRILWSWTIYVGADLLCLIGCIVHICKLI